MEPRPRTADRGVAEDIAGLVMYACGDPAFADELRERVTAELEGDADIAEFEIFERSAEERNDGPMLESELFVVALRYTDDITADLDAQRRSWTSSRPSAWVTCRPVSPRVTCRRIRRGTRPSTPPRWSPG